MVCLVNNDNRTKTNTTMTTTIINGYSVTLKLATATAPSECWVTRGSFEGSLSLLLGEGELSHRDGAEGLPVSRKSIDAITVWADANGY